MKRKALWLAAAFTLATLAPAAAQEEGVAAKKLLGFIGLIPKEAPQIEYRERAPLVVPPKMDLPPPMEVGAVRGTAWPVDPEVVKRRKAMEEAAKPVTLTSGRRVPDNPALAPGDLRQRSAGVAQPVQPRRIYGDNSREEYWLTPEQMKQGPGAKTDEAKIVPGVEPERRLLSQPPKGYRVGTQVVKPTFEPVKDHDEADPKRFIREERKRD